MSDHSIISLEIQIDELKRGPGYWKLNTSLLTDEKYISLIMETVTKILDMFKHLDLLRKWEMLKFELSNVSKEYLAKRSLDEKWKTFNLKRLLCEMQEELLSDQENAETIVDNM